MAEVMVGPDVTGDGVQDADITPSESFVNIGGVIFTDAVNTGSGTGNYNTFLAIQDNDGIEEGFNTDDAPPLDPSNPNMDHAKTHTVKLSDLVIVTIDGVQYYEFRVDLNEANSDPNAQISLDQFKLFSSSSGTIDNKATLFAQNLIYDMDAGGNVSVLLSDAESTGSGNDDYAILVPVSKFAGLDPTTTYVYLFVEMGAAGADWRVNATFEEWNLQNGVTLTGTKFEDLNGDGIKDPGEGPIEGVTIFIDSNKNGVLDAGERTTTTDADGNYSFHGVATGQTVWIDEVIPAGATQTTGDHEEVIIGDNAAAGSTILVDPIGNFLPVPELTITKNASVPGDCADTVGELITYTITLDNSGNVALDSVVLEDNFEGGGNVTLTVTGDANMNGILDVGEVWLSGDTGNDGIMGVDETWTYSYVRAVTQADIDGNGGGNGTLDNVATANAEQINSDVAADEVSDDASVDVCQEPALDISKDASVPGDCADTVGELITYTIMLDNIGNVALENVVLEDNFEGGGNVTLTVTGDANMNGTLDVGEVWLSGDTGNDGIMGVDETWTYSYVRAVTQADIDGFGGGDGVLENVATANADAVTTGEAADEVSDDASVDVCQEPALDITKDASVPGDCADTVGELITYTIMLDNIGNVTLENVVLEDNFEGGGNVTLTVTGDANMNGTLDVGEVWLSGDTGNDGIMGVDETWTYTYVRAVTQEDIDTDGYGNGTLDNVATANADAVTTGEAADEVSDDASVDVCPDPLIDLEKLVSVDSTDGTDGIFVDADAALGPQNVNLGTDVWFKVTLENSGNVTLTDVDVVDNNTTTGMPGTFFDLVIDGALTADAINNHAATLEGDTDGDNELDVGETWTITYKMAFDPGNHVNTASVTTAEGAEDDDPAHYFSLIDLGPCPRTPGFWQNMKNGGQFWDGIVGNEKNAGQPGFADGELLYDVDSNNDGLINGSDQMGLLVGDYNKNGLTDAGEDTLFISYADARSLINASNKQLNGLSGDGKFMLGRDMVATWLNYLAGTNIGDASDAESPHHYLDDSIDWMQIFSGNTAGGNSETFDTFKLAGPAIKTNSAAWNTDQAGFDHSAAEMHFALDYYNNTGQTEPGGTIYAHCESDEFLTALQAYSLV